MLSDMEFRQSLFSDTMLVKKQQIFEIARKASSAQSELRFNPAIRYNLQLQLPAINGELFTLNTNPTCDDPLSRAYDLRAPKRTARTDAQKFLHNS